MGLALIKRQENHVLGIWKIKESLEEAVEVYNKPIPLEFKSEKRQLEYILTRLLLQQIDENLKISYNDFGAPTLNNNKYISISHSSDLIAVIISKKKVAIDIEKISNKPLKIKHKFISNFDSILDNNVEVTLAWSAKETVYKLHQQGKIDFKKDIIIQKIDIIKKQIHITFQKKNLVLNFKKINNHFLVYVCI